jgi:hypothetical protein
VYFVRQTFGIPHYLLWNATDIDTGAAHPPLFNYCHTRTVLGGSPGRRNAATAPTYGDQIVLLRHIHNFFSNS